MNVTIMNAASIRCLLTILWSAIVKWIMLPFAFLAAMLSDRLKEQLAARPDFNELSKSLARQRGGFDDCIVFFCSSAGEYEQAKPLIDRLSASGRVLCHVFFFSVSGAKFIKVRGDHVSWSMSPFDDVWIWGNLFAALRPSKTIIVRHELWPAFLWQASRWSQVIVVNAVVPSLFGRQSKWRDRVNLTIKSWLLMFVDKICVVDASDKDFYERWLKIPAQSIVITGDTKYDRVVERSEQIKSKVTVLRSLFRKHWSPAGCDILLIGGSVHLPDIDLLMGALGDVNLRRIKILLVPHDVSSGNIARIFERVRQLHFTCELLSEIENAKFEFSGVIPRVIIADEMGRLSDLYVAADLAWIGGAVHGKVHNVIEPAAWGIPVHCGTHFQNSQEAVALHRAKLLFVAENAQSLRDYLINNLDGLAAKGGQTLNFVRAMAGASQKVLTLISEPSVKKESV
jgi:3-deoxy-D-manno-octulosonic-acid transferase